MSGDQNKTERKATLRQFTLPRTAVLRGKRVFSALFTGGRILRGKEVDLRYTYDSRKDGRVLVAFIAGRRLGNAVARNRCKRMVREAYRLTQHHFQQRVEIAGGELSIAFIAKRCGSDLESLLKQMQLLSASLRITPEGGDQRAV